MFYINVTGTQYCSCLFMPMGLLNSHYLPLFPILPHPIYVHQRVSKYGFMFTEDNLIRNLFLKQLTQNEVKQNSDGNKNVGKFQYAKRILTQLQFISAGIKPILGLTEKLLLQRILDNTKQNKSYYLRQLSLLQYNKYTIPLSRFYIYLF